MKRRFNMAVSLCAVCALSLSTPAIADDQAQNQPASSGVIQTQDQPGQLAEKDMILESSQLAKLDVYNEKDLKTKLGSMQNLLIHAPTGKVLYGILDTGLAGKLIPVPIKAVRLGKTVDENEYWFALNKTERELANAPTFDKDQWPNFADSKWKETVDTFFGIKADDKSAQDAESTTQITAATVFQSSHLQDLDVFNRTDPEMKLGNVDNLVIDLHRDQVIYAIVDTGLASKSVAVPWVAMDVQKAADEEDKYWLTLNKSQDELASAPAWEGDDMARFADTSFRQTVDNFFGLRTATPTETREK